MHSFTPMSSHNPATSECAAGRLSTWPDSFKKYFMTFEKK